MQISTLFTSTLERLTTHKDRHIKGHSLALLKRLQDINPLDEISDDVCAKCYIQSGPFANCNHN